MSVVFTDPERFAAALAAVQPGAVATTGRPRSARHWWTPTVGRLYGIKPWEMGRLTLRELQLLADDLETLAESNSDA